MDIWHFQIMGLPGINPLKTDLFFRPLLENSKAEWREVGSTITFGPSVPIIICTPLTSTDRVGEQKWPALQMARENWKKKVCETADAPASFDMRKRFGFPVSRTQTEEMRRKTQYADKHWPHFFMSLFVCFNNAVKMVMWTHWTGRFWYRYIQKISYFSCISSTYHACQHTAWINVGLLMRGASFVRL